MASKGGVALLLDCHILQHYGRYYLASQFQFRRKIYLHSSLELSPFSSSSGLDRTWECNYLY